MEYNLVRNGYLSASGTMSLSLSQLETLKDGNTTSSGVSITSSGTLYLDLDLSERIKVDEIRLYADNMSHTGNVTFSYRNSSSDSFTDLTTYAGGSYYYTSISLPSAPRYLKVTISGADLNLYEFLVYNDDYIVGFGADGSEYQKYINDAPTGSIGDPTTVKIYNNSDLSMPADAYASLDPSATYTTTSGWKFLEISSSYNGPYYSIDDGALIEDNELISNYRWDLGTYSDTEVSDNQTIVLTDAKLTEYYDSLYAYVDGARLEWIDLPLVDNDEGFNTGNDTWDYDRVNKKMYAVGLDSSTCKLWEYKQSLNEWSYIGEIYSPGAGSHDDNSIVMSYCDGKVYVMTKLDGSGFASYTLSGTQDNYHLLADPSWSYSLDSLDRIGMCSDGNRYVYAITSNYSSSIDQNFKRFDTVSGTWSDLDNSYMSPPYTSGGGTNYGNNVTMTYDYDRGYIYLIIASEEQASGGKHYIQRYDVANDSWNTNYLYVQSVFDTEYVAESIDYYDSCIFVSCNPGFGGYFFKYNVSTAEVTTYNLGYTHIGISQGSAGVNMLVTDPPDTDFGFTAYFAQMNDDRTKMLVMNPHSPYISTPYTGTYTTPIFKLENKYNASFFHIENDGIISQDGIAIDTIEIRSTDIDPLVLNIFYTPDHSWRDGTRIWEWNPYLGTYSRIISYTNPSDDSGRTRAVAVDRRTGYIVASNWPDYFRTSLIMFDSSFNYDRWINYTNWYNVRYYYREMDFDNRRGVWCVNHFSRNNNWYGIYHYNKYLNNEGYVQFSSDQCYDMAVELDGVDGDGVWYVNSTLNTLVHLDGSASTLQTIYLGTPRGICPTLDNGCWVYDFSTDKFYRYDKNGSLVSTINGDEETHLRGHRMTHDYNNGFWCRDSSYISHVTKNGVRDVGPIYIQNADRVYGCRNGCFVAEHTTDEQYFIGLESGSIEYNTSLYGSSLCYGSAASYNYEDAINFNYDFVPASYDPVWSNLEFKTVPKEGFFLPKVKYHQVRLTLAAGGTEPEVKKVIMTPAINLSNIQPGSYQNLYVRTNIPAGANIDDYDASIRAWWDIQDS